MDVLENEDPRMGHIQITSQQVLHFDIGHWKELIWKEENQAVIKDFLDTPATIMLLVYFDKNEKLTLSLELPKRPPTPKSICFFLKSSIVISMENYKEEIIFGNICDFPLNQYQDFFGKVVAPLFCNPQNHSRWPREIVQDITNHFQGFKTTLSYHVGLAEEKTVLMIPEAAKLIQKFELEEMSENDRVDWEFRSTLNSITEMLSNWIPIVREVLEITPEHILSQVDQGPDSEILFWSERRNNLEYIYNQVNDPLVQKMVLALEKTNNCHFPNFKMFLQDMAEGLDEAREICDSFTTMLDKIQELGASSVPELIDILPETMKFITASWIQSKYYRSVPSRIIVLLQKICCFLIEKVHQFLDPLNLFKGDRDKTKSNVKLSLDLVNLLLKSYYECREQIEVSDSKMKLYPWEFPDERIFSQFEGFIHRLGDTHEIFLAADVYFNIPSQKLISVQEAPYRIRLEDLRSKFAEAYEKFELSSYNALDLMGTVFDEDFDAFSKKLEELDHKLGTAVGQVCLTCTPAEDAFKIMDMFQDVVKRPVVQEQFRKQISSHIINIYKDFLTAKQSYSDLMTVLDKSGEGVIYKNLPEISGLLQWSLDLQKQLMSPLESLDEAEQYFKDSDEYKFTFKTEQELGDLLSKFEDYILERLKIKMNKLDEKLEQVLFVTDDECHVVLNFDSEISEAAQEIRYLKQIKKDNLLPEEALKFDAVYQNLLLAQSFLACSVQWYNDLNQSVLEYEKGLILKEWDEIYSLLQEGHSQTWISDGLPSYAEKIYNLTKSVYENVAKAKKNVLQIEKLIKDWCDEPVYVRETPNSLMDFYNLRTPMYKKVIRDVRYTARRLITVSKKNALIFDNSPKSDEWRDYTSYLESKVEKGLEDVIKCSLDYILKNTDPYQKKIAPFCKVSMLLEGDVKFQPPLNDQEEANLVSLYEAVIEQIYSLTRAIKRLTDPNRDYYDVICQNEELESLKSSIMQNVLSGVNKALAECEKFNKYSDVWLMNITEVLEDFVLHGPIKDVESDEEDTLEEVELKPPTEEEFRIEITQFEELHRTLDDIPLVLDIESWLILDSASFKESLLTLIRKWSSSYKSKLVEMKNQGKLRMIEDDGDI